MSCYGFLLVDNDRILMVLGRNGKWSFPKGKFEREKDRNGYECARRETIEETGLVGYDYIYNSEPIIEYTEKETISCKYYRCKITQKNLDYGFLDKHNDPDNGEIIESRFFPIDEVERLSSDCFLERRKEIAINFLNNINSTVFDLKDRFMIPWKQTKLSKTISFWLRHNLDLFESFSSDGYVSIDELVDKINSNSPHDFIIDKSDIENVSIHCFKQRTQIENDRIRAVQGHSSGDINDDELLTLITEPLTDCYHATDKKSLKMIFSSGLKKMKRKHIHFAHDSNLLRKDKKILIEVMMKEAMDDGIKFYRSNNNVILSPGIDGVIDPKYLIIHYK